MKIFFLLTFITPVTTATIQNKVTKIPILYKYLGLIPNEFLNQGYIWQAVTYMFLHDIYNLWHIILNMLVLFMFGLQFEREIGSNEFLLYYSTVGIGSGIIIGIGYSFIGGALAQYPTIGASAAIYGLLLAFATRHPNQPIYIWGILPVKAYVLLIIFAAIEFFSQVLNLESGISHLGHLSGLFVGFLYFLIRYGQNPIKEIRRNIRY
jgi:membrane associated rhomboid family serine protease